MRSRSVRIDPQRVFDQAEVPSDARGNRLQLPPVTPRGEQIAGHAIEFFNELGAARMSINQLAASLGMSPGNLHYHFRTNSALYLALFDILNREVRDILLRPRMPMHLDDIVQHQIDIQAVLWRHRYFFRDLDYLINSDPTIFVEFVHLQNWALDQLVALHEFYRTNFNLRPIEPPNSGIEVAQNTWMLWISWIRWEAIANAKVALSQDQLNEIFHRLAWHHFSLHGPYMSSHVAMVIGRKLRQKLSKAT